MSNQALNAHIKYGSPLGSDAGLDEIADWAGEKLLDLKSMFDQYNDDVEKMMFTGKREWAVERLLRFKDDIANICESGEEDR